MSYLRNKDGTWRSSQVIDQAGNSTYQTDAWAVVMADLHVAAESRLTQVQVYRFDGDEMVES